MLEDHLVSGGDDLAVDLERFGLVQDEGKSWLDVGPEAGQ